jgi:ATP-dependent RNA helicase DeaD
MFSATVPRSITGLARRYQRDAVRISANPDQQQHVDIDYRALTVAPSDRENAIVNVLRHVEAKNALVFCATRATVNHMTSRFNNRGFSVVALSGELSQTQRSHALQALRDGRARVCIATDVAARGIDLPNLELVIHADLPKNREGLLHRSGRTGRAGRKGVSVLIVPHSARSRTERLLKSANVTAEWARPPSIDDIMQRDRERILDDPALSEPPTEDELAFATDLLGKHGPEQIATAFLRLYRTGQSAPEELLDTAPPEPRKKRRDDFRNGVWFSLSVGRKHNAEPRWLVPMLCRAGHLTKADIGAIKIRPDETHVELHPDCVEKFFAAIGPSRMVEDSISIKPLAGAPPAQHEATGPSAGKPRAARKPYEGKKPYKGKKPYEGKKPYQARTPAASAVSGQVEEAATPKQVSARDASGTPPDRPSTKGKKHKLGKKPVGKKGRKPSSARKRSNPAAPNHAPDGGAVGPGFAPRKRKKPSNN